MMSLTAMSVVDTLCMSGKGGTGGDGWVHPHGEISMVVSVLFVINRIRNQLFHLQF